MNVWIAIDGVLEVIDRVVDKTKSIGSSIKSLPFDDFVTLFVTSVIFLTAWIYSLIKSAFGIGNYEVTEEGESGLSFNPSTSESEADLSESKPSGSSKSARTSISSVPKSTTTSSISITSNERIKSVKIQELLKRHPAWKVTVTSGDRRGDYPGCPKSSITGRISNYDEHILYSIEVLMSKASLELNGACGIVGNLMAESGLLPISFNRSAGGYGAQGIAQWRQWIKDPKEVKVKGRGRIGNYVAIYGVMPVYDDNFDHQINFVVWELNNESWRRPSKGASLRKAALEGWSRYEGAQADRKSNPQARINNAKYAYNLYMNAHSSGRASKRVISVKSTNSNRYKQ